MSARFILWPEDEASLSELGGKAWALRELRHTDIAIPEWFVVTPRAFYACLSKQARRRFDETEDANELRAALDDLTVGDELSRSLRQATQRLAGDGRTRFAVRSSAVDEDGSEHSFAGQLESFLGVEAADTPDKILQVWRSGFSESLSRYRQRHGLRLTPSPPAVLVQRMVAACVAGVAFSADPVSGRRKVCVINAVPGLADRLVSGETDADAYFVSTDGAVRQQPSAGTPNARCFAAAAGGGVTPAFDEVGAGRPTLAPEQAAAVAKLARAAERRFSRPQDIEWAIADGRLYLLQSRPITALSRLADADGKATLWDNSNIVESYSGVTTPLTFSFVRMAYGAVYCELMKILRVPARRISQNAAVFDKMLGLIRGRVYYNLNSWYQLLSLLPGFSLNRTFMERMMGVTEALPDGVLERPGTLRPADRFIEAAGLLATAFGLLKSFFTIESAVKRFYLRLNDVFSKGGKPLDEMSAQELVDHYRYLEARLLHHWDAPLANDLFAMIFFGSLGKLIERWCAGADPGLQNDLLVDVRGMISAEPAKRVRQMAEVAAAHEGLVRQLVDGSPNRVRAAIKQVPEFDRLYNDYLNAFGDRCLQELKLESITLREQPMTLLRTVGHLARAGAIAESPENSADAGSRAEKYLQARLRRRPIKRIVLRWVLKHARRRVRDRENLRFERTRVFGRVRQVFLGIGRHLYAWDLLAEPRDVFYLETHEVLGAVEGTASTVNFRELVALRKREYAGYQSSENEPDERFITWGGVQLGNSFRAAEEDAAPAGETGLTGLGCCPGTVRGVARVIRDPHKAVIQPGEILVAEHTDPGWIMLFASAAGVIVERGSLLSHSAIVAREMNIPAIVAAKGVMQRLQDGATVQMNGSSGRIDIVSGH